MPLPILPVNSRCTVTATKKLPRSVTGRRHIEPYECEFGAVVRCTKEDSPSYFCLPLAGQSCSFMYMAVKADERLPRFDKTPYRDTPDVKIERCVVEKLVIQRRAIETGVIGWGVEQEHGITRIVTLRQRKQIALDGSPPHLALFGRDAMHSFLWRDAARFTVSGNVVAFPVFQSKRCRRNAAIPVHKRLPHRHLAIVAVMPKAQRVALRKGRY